MHQGVPEVVDGAPKCRAVEMLEQEFSQDRHVCVGLDPNIDDFRKYYEIEDRSSFKTAEQWNEYVADFLQPILEDVIDVTAPYAAMYKPNAAFYEQYGTPGVGLLEGISDMIKSDYSTKVLTIDAKRGDIGSTAAAYARAIFEGYGAHATTVNPYLGADAVKPFTEYKNNLSFLLVRTSNPDAAVMQDVLLEDGRMYWEYVADQAVKMNTYGNVGVVIGATAPQHLSRAREILGPRIPILAPGVGKQGGSPEAVMAAGNAVVNASRSLVTPDLLSGESHIDGVRRSIVDLGKMLVSAKRAV